MVFKLWWKSKCCSYLNTVKWIMTHETQTCRVNSTKAMSLQHFFPLHNLQLNVSWFHYQTLKTRCEVSLRKKFIHVWLVAEGTTVKEMLLGRKATSCSRSGEEKLCFHHIFKWKDKNGPIIQLLKHTVSPPVHWTLHNYNTFSNSHNK